MSRVFPSAADSPTGYVIGTLEGGQLQRCFRPLLWLQVPQSMFGKVQFWHL